jgi:hypothetical protein
MPRLLNPNRLPKVTRAFLVCCGFTRSRNHSAPFWRQQGIQQDARLLNVVRAHLDLDARVHRGPMEDAGKDFLHGFFLMVTASARAAAHGALFES